LSTVTTDPAEAVVVDSAAAAAAAAQHAGAWSKLIRNPSVMIGGAILLFMIAIGIVAPWLNTLDPGYIDPTYRNQTPGTERVLTGDDGSETLRTYWMGTDTLGRDTYSRVIYGARVSITIGIVVALLSVCIGLVSG
jgi:peptide/nickel transport system permease protein